jgi:hypothetical protein
MKIILTSSDGNLFATVETWQQANEVARAIFRRNYWSDLYYEIHLGEKTEVTGSIDLEPASFHTRHQKTLFTTHLRTFWGNISKQKPPYKYGLNDAEVKHFAALLYYLNFSYQN